MYIYINDTYAVTIMKMWSQYWNIWRNFNVNYIQFLKKKSSHIWKEISKKRLCFKRNFLHIWFFSKRNCTNFQSTLLDGSLLANFSFVHFIHKTFAWFLYFWPLTEMIWLRSIGWTEFKVLVKKQKFWALFPFYNPGQCHLVFPRLLLAKKTFREGLITCAWDSYSQNSTVRYTNGDN